MALFKIAISRVTGRGTHLFDGTGVKMLSGYGVHDLSDKDVGSKFQYTMNLENDREGMVRIESNFLSTAIAAYVNASDQASFITLSVYPEQNTTLATKEELILIQNISLGYDCDAGAILYVKRGTELQRIMVAETIDEILEVSTTATIEWDDGTDYFRLQTRSGYLALDQVINPDPGFEGAEDVDWSCIWSISYS